MFNWNITTPNPEKTIQNILAFNTPNVAHYKLEEIRALINEADVEDGFDGFILEENNDKTSTLLQKILHILGPEDIQKLWNRI